MKILYIGNSITLHSPAPDIGWHGCYGMAASCEENDYLHVLNRILEDAGKTVVWKCRNAADYERSPETYNLEEQLSEERDFSPDIIVMRLIENVPPDKTAAFRDWYVRMIRFLNPCGRAAVFCTGAFWQRDDADAWIEEAAAEVGGTYVSLKTAQGEAFQAIGLFEHGGVAGHPSDVGMAKIAELLYNAIDGAGLLNGAVFYPVPEGDRDPTCMP